MMMILLSVLFLILTPEPIVYLNLSESAPKGIYKIIDKGLFDVGEFYLIASSSLPFDMEEKKLIKKLRFKNKEKVEIRSQELYVNNSWICSLHKNDIFNPTDTKYVLSVSEGLFINDHNYSFDSRYFGPVKLENVRRLKLIWKF